MREARLCSICDVRPPTKNNVTLANLHMYIYIYIYRERERERERVREAASGALGGRGTKRDELMSKRGLDFLPTTLLCFLTHRSSIHYVVAMLHCYRFHVVAVLYELWQCVVKRAIGKCDFVAYSGRDPEPLIHL